MNGGQVEHFPIRRFERRGCLQLSDLMRALAASERYLDRFRVTEEQIVRRGFGTSRQFT